MLWLSGILEQTGNAIFLSAFFRHSRTEKSFLSMCGRGPKPNSPPLLCSIAARCEDYSNPVRRAGSGTRSLRCAWGQFRHGRSNKPGGGGRKPEVCTWFYVNGGLLNLGVIIRQQVVLKSQEDFNSMIDSEYLLKNKSNATRLWESIGQHKAGAAFSKDIPLNAPEDKAQAAAENAQVLPTPLGREDFEC
ncbi:antitoxin YefM [compost metagenome]